MRDLADPPMIWSEGAARVLDYGGDGPSVLFVPSLVNRAYILDLMPGQSMMRWFAGRGVRPLLLDWGWPGAAERDFTLTDYVAGVLERAIGFLAGAGTEVWAGAGPIVLGGYCIGGLLTLAASLRRPALVRGLALLATPWDFAAGGAAREVPALLPLVEPLLHATRTLPVDALQTLFALGDMGGIGRKYREFGAMDQGSEAARRFVALEDWANDGVPLAAPVARETLGGWYGANTPASGTWRVAGEVVTPSLVQAPCFVAVPARDRIVPPESALALARAIPHAEVHRPSSGHIGMAAGPRAESNLWIPLLGWLRGL